MEKSLLVSILIVVLPFLISAFTGSYCEKDYGGQYVICGYGKTITVIYSTTESDGHLILNVNKFSKIARNAFRNVKINSLDFYSPSPRCNPQVIDLTPELFHELLSVSSLTLHCVKFAVELNSFINLKCIFVLTLDRAELPRNVWEFLADFPLLDSLSLADLNITTISPKKIPRLNEDLEQLCINNSINFDVQKSWRRSPHLKSLIHRRYLSIRRGSGIFDNYNRLTYLNLYKNKITVLPKHVFKELRRIEALILNKNEIMEIAPEVFSGLNLSLLLLSHNKLEYLSVRVFQNLRNLEILDLSFNKIRTVPYNIFKGCVSLESLSLDHNKIYYIEPTAFYGLNLKELHLNDNHLTVLEHDAFIGLRVRNLLDLRSNNISKIEPQAFRKLSAGKVSLCYHNTTSDDRDRWGVDETIKNIVINDC